MNETLCLTNQFLIAMPNLADPNFHHAVTYVCEHTPEGAMGFIINRPVGLTLEHVLEQMDIEQTQTDLLDVPILYGGPLQPERGFVIHRPATLWRSTLVLEDLAITTSQDVLDAIAAGDGPEDVVIALGYAGWASDQLEAELAENSWLNCKASHDIIFKTPLAE